MRCSPRCSSTAPSSSIFAQQNNFNNYYHYLIELLELEPRTSSISINHWQGEQRLQLELKAIRTHTELVLIDRGSRQYTARWTEPSGLMLTNGEGETLRASIQQEKSLTSNDDLARDQRVIQLIEEACLGLGLRP